MPTTRKGFTLVELLVVIAIIGQLAGLLLPAVQSAREAARRTTCANNMKQVATAILNYESGTGELPNAGKVKIPSQCTNDDCRGGSLYITILPFIEQSALYDMYPQDNPRGWLWWGGDAAWRPYDSTVDHWANGISHAKMAISTYQCPSYSDWVQHPVRRDYLVLSGGKTRAGYVGHGGTYTDGLFVVNRQMRVSKITDGLTKTFMFGEIAHPHWAGYGTGYQNGHVGGPAEWFCGPQCERSNNCDPVRGTPDKFSSSVRFPINRDFIGEGYMPLDVANDIPYGSRHPGGAQFAFADGRIEFVSETIDFSTYQSFATFAGRD